MNDTGPTGIQVAPAVPTEDEMTHVQDILKRAINSLVGMSQLQADVDMLRSTVQSLQADTERLRSQNAGLDEALFQSRNARNAANAELEATKLALRQAEQDKDHYKHDCELHVSTIQNLSQSLEQTKHERDDHGFRVMELEEQVKALQAKLDAIHDGYRSIFGDEPKAMQVPVPIYRSEPTSSTTASEPEPTAIELTKPWSPPPSRRYLDQWEPGAIWDEQEHKYFVHD